MVDLNEQPASALAQPEQSPPALGRHARVLALVVIVLVAAGLRLRGLGATSLWYDEVITMRVARASGHADLIARLGQLDGTRAPLHPLVLQAWLRAFGSSDLAGRSFSVLCGLLTIAVIYALGRATFGEATALWAAWLAAVCPPLVYYSQEARMYAWLVLLTCLSWLVFLSFRRQAKPAQCLAYGLLLVSLAYSHPLGLFMVAAAGLAYLLVRPSLELSLGWWLAIQFAVVLTVAPWLGPYMDHGTDYPMPRYPIRYLLAVPIEYVGGNAIVLFACTSVIAFGLFAGERNRTGRRFATDHVPENLILLTWTAAPPISMYLYSYLFQPIFGPARYHLFVAPAYLILLAHGLAKLPSVIRWPAAAAGLVLSLRLIGADVYTPAVKADWRALGEWLDQEQSGRPAGDSLSPVTIVIHPSDPRFPRDQIEAARYYLSPRFRVVSDGEGPEPSAAVPATIYDAYCLSKSQSPAPGPNDHPFHGLLVKRRAKVENERQIKS
jgi:4-amino-4-deoxy-L-arabinose transferase-like glycosyltransferase